MLQQIIALIIIAFFVIKLIKQKTKNTINRSEFILWLVFWIVAGLAIVFLKQIDALVKTLGFSGSGINFLLYVAVIILFYFIFKIRLNLVKLEDKLTSLSREITLKNNDKNE